MTDFAKQLYRETKDRLRPGRDYFAQLARARADGRDRVAGGEGAE